MATVIFFVGAMHLDIALYLEQHIAKIKTFFQNNDENEFVLIRLLCDLYDLLRG